MPFGEEEVEDGEDGGESGRPLVGGWECEGDIGRGERFLRPDDALLDRRDRDEEGAGDLLAGQAPDDAESERELSLPAQDGMTGDEDEPEDVVVDGIGVPGQCVRTRDLLILEAAPECCDALIEALTPPPRVDRTSLRHGHQPSGGIRRHPGLRPRCQGLGQRLLRKVLGEPEIADVAGEGGDDLRPLDPPRRRDHPGHRLGGVRGIRTA